MVRYAASSARRTGSQRHYRLHGNAALMNKQTQYPRYAPMVTCTQASRRQKGRTGPTCRRRVGFGDHLGKVGLNVYQSAIR